MDEIKRLRNQKEDLLCLVSFFATIALNETEFTDAGIKGCLLLEKFVQEKYSDKNQHSPPK